MYVGTENCLSGWVATYAHRLQSLHNDAWALMPSCFWGGILLGRLTLPAVLRGVSELRLMRTGLALGAIGCAILLASHDIPGVAAGCAIAGLALAGVFPIAMSWLSEYCGTTNLQFAGLMLAIAGLGGRRPALAGRLHFQSARQSARRFFHASRCNNFDPDRLRLPEISAPGVRHEKLAALQLQIAERCFESRSLRRRAHDSYLHLRPSAERIPLARL